MPSSFTYELIIKEHHLDSYKHVNNATYLSLYEEARWEVCTQRGFGYHQIHKIGMGPVILGVDIKFMKELNLREKIGITFEVLSYEKKLFKIKQQMIKANGQIASEAIFTGGFFDMKERKLIQPTEEWLKVMY
jgi:YbgC/YbaW family acyl-CoA thioester hydrolase